jgi:hypothetical protein
MKSLLVLTAILVGTSAYAGDHGARKAAWESCFTETGVKKPDHKKHEKLSKSDKKKMKACMKAKKA